MRNYLPRRVPMIRNRRGMGADCSTNPCTWWDDVYLRDACKAFLTDCDPANPLLTIVNKGLLVGGADVLGTTVGTTVGTAVGTAVESTGTSIFSNPVTGQVNWVPIALIAGGVLLLFQMIPAGGRR